VTEAVTEAIRVSKRNNEILDFKKKFEIVVKRKNVKMKM